MEVVESPSLEAFERDLDVAPGMWLRGVLVVLGWQLGWVIWKVSSNLDPVGSEICGSRAAFLHSGMALCPSRRSIPPAVCRSQAGLSRMARQQLAKHSAQWLIHPSLLCLELKNSTGRPRWELTPVGFSPWKPVGPQEAAVTSAQPRLARWHGPAAPP